MKKIFTLIALFAMVCSSASYAQSALRLIENLDGRLEVQAKLGVSETVLPGPGAAPCAVNPSTDSLMFDFTFTIGFDPAEVASVTIYDVDCSNNFYCFCGIALPPPTGCVGPGAVPSTGLVGSTEVSSGTFGDINWQTYGSFDATCTGSDGFFNYSEKWENEVYYTMAIFDVELAPSPPGTEPLDLTDMVSLDEGVWNTDLLNNITTGNLTLGLNPITYPNLAVEATPVPLSLLGFNASKEGDKSARLEWTTANEVSTKLFVIQRSSDRENWSDIGGVEAAGFNSGILEYSFIDKNVYNGRSEREMYYYRLKMVDRDDAFDYSNIDVVSFNTFGDNESTFDLFVFPNPAKDGFNVEINQVDDETPITRLELLDIAGRVVYSRDFDEGSLIEYVDFDRYNVTAGTYVLKATDATGNLKAHEKIVVTR